MQEIEQDLTIVLENPLSKYGVHRESEKIKLYKTYKNYVMVPRFYPSTDSVKNFYKPVQVPHIFITEPLKLISTNQTVIFEYFERFYSKPNGLNLILATGQGKTFLATKLAQHLKLKTLVVAPNKEIAKTWLSVLQNICKPVLATRGDNSATKSAVTVGVINTLVKQDKKWFDFDFVIYDEVTEYLSEKRRIIFELTAKPYLLGLTATPDVPKKRIFELHVGMLFYANNLRGFKNPNGDAGWKANVTAVKYFGSEEYTQKITSCIGLTSAVEMDKQFASDNTRNNIIVDYIIELHNAKKNIYVFVSQCELAVKLNEILQTRMPKKTYFLMGKKIVESTDVKTLNEVEQPIVFTTYKFSSKGISVPKMNAVILCQPRMADTEQTMGRILRIGGNLEETREIIDIIDMNTTLKRQFSVRKKIYEKLNFKIFQVHKSNS